MSVQFPSTATSGVIAGLDSTATYQFQVFATVTVDGRPLQGERSCFIIDGKECTFVYYVRFNDLTNLKALGHDISSNCCYF